MMFLQSLKKPNTMTKVNEYKGYAYWVGYDSKKGRFYNIVPIGQVVNGGYYGKEYILGIKKVPDLFLEPKPLI